jgi:hypothetical protein
MAVYVDDMIRLPKNAGVGPAWHWPSSCHLWADTLLELAVFAQKLALKDGWLQASRRPGRLTFIHFDLNEPKRAAAIHLGAKPVGQAGLKDHLRRLRGERQC